MDILEVGMRGYRFDRMSFDGNFEFLFGVFRRETWRFLAMMVLRKTKADPSYLYTPP